MVHHHEMETGMISGYMGQYAIGQAIAFLPVPLLGCLKDVLIKVHPESFIMCSYN